MKIGDLVRYRDLYVDRYKGVFDDKIGLIMGKCPVKTFGHYLVIQWTNGARFSEHRKFLELVKK